MAKKHLLPKENEEFLDRLGLTETDKKVYIIVLDGGLLSAGEIQQLTEINDFKKVLLSIRDLIDLGLVKVAEGSMNRYYATLPFFRETLSVEREFKFALEAMLQSLGQSKEQTKQNRERIIAIKFPNVVDKLLDQYYKEILSPVISDLETTKNEIEDNMIPFLRELDEISENLQEEFTLMLKPLVNYSDLLSQKFDIGISNEEDKVKQFVANRKQKRLETLQMVHKTIGNLLGQLNTELGSVVSELGSITYEVEEQKKAASSVLESVTKHNETIKTTVKNVNSSADALKAELLVTREQIKRIVNSSTPEENVNDQIEEVFDHLSQKINSASIDGEPIDNSISKMNNLLENTTHNLQDFSNRLDQIQSSMKAKTSSTFNELKTRMIEAFNSINDNDDKSLDQLKESILLQFNKFRSSIIKEGKGIKSKLEQHIDEITKVQENTMSQWKDQMEGMYKKPLANIDPFLNNWVDDIKPIISSFKKESDDALTDILEPILKLENETFSTLTERISFVKAMIDGRANDLQQILLFAKNFDFTKTSDTWVVVGLPAIYGSITDLLLRTQNKVTIVTPRLDLELVELARTRKSSIRITFVADIDPDKDARLIKKINDLGRITLRGYPDRDLYACIRDSEEIIFGYEKEGEEIVGIRSATPSIVELLEDRLNETVIRNSKPI